MSHFQVFLVYEGLNFLKKYAEMIEREREKVNRMKT
jgi:hypothetical protein